MLLATVTLSTKVQLNSVHTRCHHTTDLMSQPSLGRNCDFLPSWLHFAVNYIKYITGEALRAQTCERRAVPPMGTHSRQNVSSDLTRFKSLITSLCMSEICMYMYNEQCTCMSLHSHDICHDEHAKPVNSRLMVSCSGCHKWRKWIRHNSASWQRNLPLQSGRYVFCHGV